MRTLRTLCLLGLVALLAAPLHAEPIAQRLPHDTILLISAPDLNRSWEQFKKSSLYDIWQEPTVQAFYKKVRKLIEKEAGKDKDLKKAQDEFKNKLGMDIMDLPGVLFKGEFSLALIDFKAPKDKEPEFDLLLGADYGKENKKFEQLLNWLIELSVKEGGARKDTLTIGEDKVTRLSMQDVPFKLHIATKDGRFYLTTNEATMKTVLAGGSSKGPRLSTNPSYVAARQGIDPKQEIAHFYLNMDAIWKRVDAQLPPDAKKIMDKLGVFGIKALAAGTSFDGKAIKDHFYLAMPGERIGVQKLFTFPKTDLKGLKYAPADVGSFSVGAMELGGIYKEALRVFKAIDAGEFDNFEKEKKKFEEQLGMKVDDLVAALGTQITTFTRKPKGDSEKKGKPEDLIASLFRATYIVQVTDENTARSGIEKLLKMMEVKSRTEEHHGWKLTFIDVPEENAPFKTVAYAIKDGHLFVGLPGANLKELAKEQASGSTGLAASEAFKAEMAKYPEGFSSFSYVDLAGYLRAIWKSATPYLKEALGKGKAPIEFADLPDMEAVAKHVTPMTGASYSDKNGLRMSYRSPMGGMTTLAFVGVGAAVAIPAMGQAQNRAKQTACLAKLKMIGTGVTLYKQDTGKYPEELSELVTGKKKYLIGAPFKCPSDPFPQREGKIETSFVYIYSNKLGDKNPGKTILCYDKSPQHNGNTRNVLFLDGSVQNMSDFEFRELFKVQKERLKKHGIQVFIGWGKLK